MESVVIVGLTKVLSDVAKSQPHAAFAALTHGLMGKWNFLSRTVERAERSIATTGKSDLPAAYTINYW